MGIIKKELIKDLSDIEETSISEDHLKPVGKKSNHYVNNAELYEEFVKWHEKKLKSIEEGNPRPRFSDKIGKAFLQIAKRRCNHRSFSRYSVSWKEEMIDNAVEKCVMYCNFDPNKSKNPFAYITQICNNALIQQIKIEKKQLYIKYKSKLEFDNFYGELDDNVNEGDIQIQSDPGVDNHIREFVQKHEDKHFTKGRKERSKPDLDIIMLKEFY